MVAILKQKNRQRNIRKNMNYMLWFRFFSLVKKKWCLIFDLKVKDSIKL